LKTLPCFPASAAVHPEIRRRISVCFARERLGLVRGTRAADAVNHARQRQTGAPDRLASESELGVLKSLFCPATLVITREREEYSHGEYSLERSVTLE
jgi:hypothetical protein